MTYPKVDTAAQGLTPSPAFPSMEEAVLAYWAEHDTFVKSVEQRAAGPQGEGEYVFYDGPPFANGLPHYGHLLTGYVKDLVPRYRTMRGERVERRFGWDTHGLPAELEAMSQLGIKTKEEILELGIEAFNAKCRESVLKYTDEWRDYVTRQARWVDFDNDYKTLNPDYMESVIWAFKSLYDKGLAYEGLRVLPYCWNDETPLSNHELRMDDDVYQPRQDPASTVWMELETGERAMAWTTMPWTLVPNTNLVVGADIDYAVMEHPDGHRYLLAQARLDAYAKELEGATQVATLKGSDLVGRRYTPVFDFLVEVMADVPAAYTVLAGDFVNTDEGTGLVQCAPSHGEDDFAVCTAAGIPVLLTVDEGGRFNSLAPRFEGLQVFDANQPLLVEMRERGMLMRRDSYVHPYPHCWRCREPLIYKAVSSWFVQVTAIKDRMLATNEAITWVPEHIKHGQFGKWLGNARDWAISRNRFWGSPIPVWKSDDPAYPRVDVYGSFAELEADFGDLPRNADGEVDLHRPFVDRLTRPNPDDPRPADQRSQMRRVEDVLDVWFDSGSMSYAQVHYPFENADWFEHHFPADFIVEYIGQTRGWFYTLHVLATALFDRPAFSTCISHGIVLGHDGQKASKSLGNYPDVRESFDRDGADAMRWFLMSSPILRGGNLIVTEQAIRDGVRHVLIPLWNAWYFFGLYANAAGAGSTGYDAQWSTASTHPLDRYLLAKLRRFVEATQTRMDDYDIAGACDEVRGFVDVLTNWYIRRSRDRFWDTDRGTFPHEPGSAGAESLPGREGFDTLYTALEVVCRTAAPLLPLVTEQVWRGLTGGESVHLTDWPAAEDLPADDELVAGMDAARAVCSITLSLRKAGGLRVRLPLAKVTVVIESPETLEPFADIVKDEVNVREVRVVGLAEAGASDFGVEQRLTVHARAAGPRLGRDVQRAIRGSKSGDWALAEDATVTAGGLELVEGEYSLETVVARGSGSGSSVTGILPGGGFVVLDTEVTDDLAREGLARDLVRAVQQARREAGLQVSDRISLTVVGDDDAWRAAVEHQQLVMSETLAVQFGAAGAGTSLPPAPADGAATAYRGIGELDGGRTVELLITRVAS
ncbi:isoleucine--tRNA ligase [soil metagenome]